MPLRHLLYLAAAAGAWACTSDRAERKLGDRIAAEVERQVPLLDEDDPVTIWAGELIEPLVQASAPLRDPGALGGYRLQVAEMPEVNAFAVPGGHLYVTTGLLLAAADCAEVAGVLAHEIGHVVERHAVERLEAGKIGQWLSELVFGAGTARNAAELSFAILHETSFSRRDEAEADRVAVRVADRAGYDPRALVRFMDRELANDRAGVFATHPPTAERTAQLARTIAEVQGGRELGAADCRETTLTLAQVQSLLRARRRPRR